MEEQIKQQLILTMGYRHYNGWANERSDFGYHSFNLPGVNITGQRNPSQRLEVFKKHYNFKDKVAVDIGCNVGGMLIHLPELKKGIGFDYDEKCIDAANNISKIVGRKNTEFYTHDFNKQRMDIAFEKIEKVDVVFCLAIGKWIGNVTEIYQRFLDLGADIFLELNHGKKNYDELQFFIDKGLKVEHIQKGSPDDITPENTKKRQTYFIKNA